MTVAMSYDSSKCIGCRACQVACKQWWDLAAVPTINRGEYENPPDLSAQSWNRIAFNETDDHGAPGWSFTRRACMQCTTAVCVWVCPTYAAQYDPRGFVKIDQDRCIGCGRCVGYCPFGTPKLAEPGVSDKISVETGLPKQVAYKCNFCFDRLDEGQEPACATTCPTDALQFGERSDVVARAQLRVAALRPDHPDASLYGEDLLGGLHVIEVLTEEPAIHGLPEQPRLGTYKEFDPSTYPDWYVTAVADGTLPALPPSAKREWYMQPDLAPVARKQEPAWPQKAAGTGLGWGGPALLGWAGIGVVGGLSGLWWTIRRRMRPREEERPIGGPNG